MAHRTLPDPIKGIVNAAVGGASLAAFIGGIWALLSGIGALVAHATIWLGGKPGMWSMSSMFEVVNNPTHAGVAFGFLFCVMATVALVLLAVKLLADFGESVLGILRKDAHS